MILGLPSKGGPFVLEYIDLITQKNKNKKMIKKIKAKRKARKERHYAIRNMPSDYDEAILSWIAPEAIKHERGMIWKVVTAAIILFAVMGAFYYNNILFSILILLGAFNYYVAHLEHPKDVEIVISDIGIKVGSRKYPYSRIKAFWLIYEVPYTKTLNIRVSGEMVSDITILLGDQRPSPVREILFEKIPELEGQTEKLSDILLKLLKI